jgi:hypothetical protein
LRSGAGGVAWSPRRGFGGLNGRCGAGEEGTHGAGRSVPTGAGARGVRPAAGGAWPTAVAGQGCRRGGGRPHGLVGGARPGGGAGTRRGGCYVGCVGGSLARRPSGRTAERGRCVGPPSGSNPAELGATTGIARPTVRQALPVGTPGDWANGRPPMPHPRSARTMPLLTGPGSAGRAPCPARAEQVPSPRPIASARHAAASQIDRPRGPRTAGGPLGARRRLHGAGARRRRRPAQYAVRPPQPATARSRRHARDPHQARRGTRRATEPISPAPSRELRAHRATPLLARCAPHPAHTTGWCTRSSAHCLQHATRPGDPTAGPTMTAVIGTDGCRQRVRRCRPIHAFGTRSEPRPQPQRTSDPSPVTPSVADPRRPRETATKTTNRSWHDQCTRSGSLARPPGSTAPATSGRRSIRRPERQSHQLTQRHRTTPRRKHHH